MSNHSLLAVNATDFSLDGGAMFGIIPRLLWERQIPADERHRIPMTGRVLLAASGGRRVLVDAGIGSAWSDKEKVIYGIHDDTLDLALSERGWSPEEVTDVVLTHLHFDHAGGLTIPEADGHLRPRFPNATHWVHRQQWVWAHHPTRRDAGSYRPKDWKFLGTCDGPPLQLVDEDTELWPGCRVHAFHGHTPGMQIVELSTSAGPVVFLADLMPTRAHLPEAWVTGYDLSPATSANEKARFLPRLEEERAILAFSHDRTHAFAKLERGAEGRWSTTPLAQRQLG